MSSSIRHNSTIRVKAIDKAGNETIAVLVPDTAIRTLSFDRTVGLIAVGGFTLIGLLLIVFVLVRRRKHLVEIYDEQP
jgi:phosphoribosylformylglycinamidine (FGAM) synthase-like amidotransferase family enzyme